MTAHPMINRRQTWIFADDQVKYRTNALALGMRKASIQIFLLQRL
jgi:hypothetical protein